MSKTTGGPAFPTQGQFVDTLGMTLRDYFAAKAMEGLLMEGVLNNRSIATEAYAMADAMLAARDAS